MRPEGTATATAAAKAEAGGRRSLCTGPPTPARLPAWRPALPWSAHPPLTTRSPLLCRRCTPLAASGPTSPASACRWGCQTTASTWSRAGASGRSRAPLRAAAAVQVNLLCMQVRLGAPAGAQARRPPLMASHACHSRCRALAAPPWRSLTLLLRLLRGGLLPSHGCCC